MKRHIIILSALALFFSVSCTWKSDMEKSVGYLTFEDSDISLDVEVSTKAGVTAGGSFSLMIYNDQAEEVLRTTYGNVKKNGNRISLAEGTYTLVARSTEESVPTAAFEQPVYGVSKEFDIEAGKGTSAGHLICKLLQTKVTVAYNDDFLSSVTGEGSATVSVDPKFPLVFSLNYNSGKPVYDLSSGYFAVSDAVSTTMEVTFKGYIDGKMQKMTKVFTDVKPHSWHQIKFIKKMNEEGTASFTVTIDGFVDDEELVNDVNGEENNLGDDPNAPAGDGGIALETTCGIDIYQPIEVPALGDPFVLTMKAIVPNKVKKFTVEIKSTNSAFVDAVGSINDGNNTLDLVNPSSGAIEVFTSILPFPYGSDVYDKSEIPFDLSDAQEPLLAFSGTHTFVMHVTDQKGCKKDVEIEIVVAE